MLDFKEIDKSGDDFELLVREMLYNKGLEVYWSGKGPDGGKDLLCIEKYKSNFKIFSRRWIVQCKHYAHSEKAVGISELGSIENTCKANNADGYLLVCSTFPSSTVVDMLDKIEKNSNLNIAFWDCKTLERQLLVPENWSLVNMFFPNSSRLIGWQLSKIDTYFWNASFQRNIFYIALRIGTNCNCCLNNISALIAELNQLKLPKNHYIRIRAVYFDDKYSNYLIYLDYLVPAEEKEKNIEPSEDVIEFCNERIVDGLYYDVDLKIIPYHGYSDNFDLDHQSYYSFNIPFFKTGMKRQEDRRLVSVLRDDSRALTENIKIQAFNALVSAFDKLDFVKILRAINANIENLSYFSDNFSWDDIIQHSDCNIENFFSTVIRFKCYDFDKLINLLNTFPTSVDQHFELEQHHIFLPDEGYDSDEDSLYSLMIRVHPCVGSSKFQFRLLLNKYMNEIADKINLFFNNNNKV